MKIKVNRACNVNGKAWVLKKGDVLDEEKDGQYIVELLLALGYADEVKRNKRSKTEGVKDG